MNRKPVVIIAMLIAVVLVLCGCSGISVPAGDIYERLDKLDAFKETTESQRIESGNERGETSRGVMQASGTFRNVPYGYSLFDIKRLETLGVVEEYDNAIDFELVSIFGYSMLPTYWFNLSEQMFRGSYYARTSDELKSVIDSFLGQLNDLYGTALEMNYYDFSNDVVYPTDEIAEQQAISSGQAYFYAWYSYDEIDVELYIEIETANQDVPVFEVFVNFTDYSYYDSK